MRHTRSSWLCLRILVSPDVLRASIIGCSSYTNTLGDVRLWVARGTWFQRSHERLARGTVNSTMRRAANPTGCARCGADAG